jgi:hypothetical protein
MVQFRLEMVWRGAMIDSSSCYGSIIRNNHTGTNSASNCSELVLPFCISKYKKWKDAHRKNANNRFGVTNLEKYCMREAQKIIKNVWMFPWIVHCESRGHANAHLIDISSYEISDALI